MHLPPWSRYAFAALGIFNLIWFPIAFYLFYKDRYHYPIIGRPSTVYLAYGVSIWVGCVAQAFKGTFFHTIPCLVSFILTDCNTLLVMSPLLIVRFWFIWYDFKSTQERANFVLPAKDCWYLNHAQYVKPKFLMTLFACSSLVIFCVPISFYATDYIHCEDALMTFLQVTILPAIPYMVSLFAMILKMRTVDEGYFIMEELRWMAICVSIWGVIQFFVVILFYDDQIEFFIGDRLNIIFGGTVFNLCSIGFPVYATYRSKKQTDDMHEDSETISISGLDDVLENPERRMAFQKQLVREFCIENLLFYDEIHKFKESTADTLAKQTAKMQNEIDSLRQQLATIKQESTADTLAKQTAKMQNEIDSLRQQLATIKQTGAASEPDVLPEDESEFLQCSVAINILAHEIYCKYIIQDAQYQVNVPYWMVNNIRKELEACWKDYEPPTNLTEASRVVVEDLRFVKLVNVSIFDEAVKEIHDLMSSDVLLRFMVVNNLNLYLECAECVEEHTDV